MDPQTNNNILNTRDTSSLIVNRCAGDAGDAYLEQKNFQEVVTRVTPVTNRNMFRETCFGVSLLNSDIAGQRARSSNRRGHNPGRTPKSPPGRTDTTALRLHRSAVAALVVISPPAGPIQDPPQPPDPTTATRRPLSAPLYALSPLFNPKGAQSDVLQTPESKLALIDQLASAG